MKSVFLFVLLGVWLGATAHGRAQATPLPSPLGLADVVRIAGDRRDELEAARARLRSAEAKSEIAAALPDPMLSPSIDHLPFMLNGLDYSIVVEQSFPLSGIRGHRRASALADVDRVRADVDRARLDVGLEAANAFLMLLERRRAAVLLSEQLTFARDVVSAANARYASATAPQSDVLRAEVEVARLDALARAIAGEIRAGEAMLRASLALDADAPIPQLIMPSLTTAVPAWPQLKEALAGRPELAAGRAETTRAEADLLVMHDMFKPMATVRTGPSYTMTDGAGWMAMVGVSLPIWRTKLHAGVAEAEAMRAMSQADLRAMTRMIEGEAATAAAQVQSARDRQSALATDVVPRARLAIAPSVSSYAAGQLPLVGVIEAVQALWLVQSDLITAETQLGLAWARLGRAVGSYEAIIQ